MLADQVQLFYGDLADPRFVRPWRWSISATARIRSRRGTWRSRSVFCAQRRNQYRPRQRQLDARPAEHVGEQEVRRRSAEDLSGLLAQRQRLGDVRQRARVARTDGPVAAASHVDADSRAVGGPREHARRTEGLLRVPCLPDGALGRPGIDGVYRRHDDRAVLDRNGLRPGRYCVTKGGWSSWLPRRACSKFRPSDVDSKGRCGRDACSWSTRPRARSSPTSEIKQRWPRAHPYREWIDTNQVNLADLPEVAAANGHKTNGHPDGRS